MSIETSQVEAAPSKTAAVTKKAKISSIYLFGKRSLDIIGAILGLIISSPLFIVISIMYSFGDSKGPLFFKQQRYGKNEKLFYIYKLRSMVVNADEILKRNKVLYQKYINNNYKLEQDEDPRITRLGRILRKFSLDELPQLINVLKGEMSLVGPRPIVEEELKEYKHKRQDLLAVKPGMTGYWQVCGRSDIGYPERVDLELYYVYHQSMYLDIKILLRTLAVVVLKKGAY
ncbi:sugar transferase [Bacillus sp. sid0103]|uniref:sugar transferase n=1 Tax=Bacillus sp. sid0103 TaxID=2856337 RepID=UPI001C439A42|nr:sugar transferase [Bacillus sp. sid0103]MBV7505577.1 sugar transferase [Bacillus sp. sid0103]